jgi:hypothetical protein
MRLASHGIPAAEKDEIEFDIQGASKTSYGSHTQGVWPTN